MSAEDLTALISAFKAEQGQVDRSCRVGRKTRQSGDPAAVDLRGRPAACRAMSARAISSKHAGLPVVDVDIGPAAHLDLDTPEAIIAAGGILKG